MAICKTKQWGHSIGIIIPRAIVKEKNIKPEEEVLLTIEKKRSVLKDLFGSLQFKKSTKTLLKESRKVLDSKFD